MLEAAKREAREENGIKSESVRSVELLGRVMVNQISFTSDTALLVMDCDSTNVASDLDVAEGIRSAFWITPGELLDRIKAGTYEDARYDNGPLLWTMMTLMAHKPYMFLAPAMSAL